VSSEFELLRGEGKRYAESLDKQMAVPNFVEVQLLGGLLRVRGPGFPRNFEEANRRLQAAAWLSGHPGDVDRARKVRLRWRRVALLLAVPVVLLLWIWALLLLGESIISALL